MLKWYLDKRPQHVKNLIPNLTEYKFKLKIGVPCHKYECPPNILIHTKPFLATTNLSMIKSFNKTLLFPLHDMSITLEMIITGYPKVL